MLDPNFEASVVYVFDSGDGAAGLVLNRPTDVVVHDVMPELTAAVAAPPVVFHGGPVAVEQGLVLGVTDGAISVLTIDEAAAAMPGSVRLFAGYAGWESQQLDGEIEAGGWFVFASIANDILTPNPLALWRAVFARQQGEIRRYRSYPDDPSLN